MTSIPAGKKRLLVRGALADGTPFIQEGFDETGMILFVDGSSASVDLVVEPRGAVIFDPAMITPDEPIAAYPTAIELPGTAIAASPTPNMSPTAAPAAAEPRLLATDTPKPTSTPPVMPSTPPRRPTIPWQAAGFVGVAFIIGLVVFRKQ